MSEKVRAFTGVNSFLSNFYPCKIHHMGLEFPSVEHAYQASKCILLSDVIKIKEAKSPGEAKRLGRKVRTASAWDNIKLRVMENLVRRKFLSTFFKDALLQTGDKILEEGNCWGDKFWGIYEGEGENHLGKILMKIRQELRNA